MQSPQVYLLSAPSGAGKTTSLIRYVDILRKQGKSVGGVLQIVIDKKRHVRFLSNDCIKLLQMNDVFAHNIQHDQHYIKSHTHTHSHSHSQEHKHSEQCCNHGHDDIPDNYDQEKYVKCGRFLCAKNVLNDAQNELNNAYKYDFIMVDEVGNWEMKKNKDMSRHYPIF
eukprot:UN08487